SQKEGPPWVASGRSSSAIAYGLCGAIIPAREQIEGWDETPRFCDFTRRRDGWTAIRPRRGAESDASDWLPWRRVGGECSLCKRIRSGTARSRLRRGAERRDRIPLGRGPL